MQPRPLDSHWLEKYYMSKFRLSKVGDSFRANIAGEYIKGLCWVLRYYFQGCASWSWYFPAYYSPYAADFSLIESVEIEFDKSEPSKPYEQLLSILPPFSANILPQPLRYLLVDESSPIKYNFPDTFEIDTEGVKYEWQGKPIRDNMTPMRTSDGINFRGCITPFCRYNEYKEFCVQSLCELDRAGS